MPTPVQNPWLAMQPGADPFAAASLQPQALAALAPPQRSRTAALGLDPLVYAPPEQPVSKPFTQSGINAQVASTQAPVPTATSTPKTYGEYDAKAPDTSRLQTILDQQEKLGQQGIGAQRQGIDQYGNQIDAAKAMPMGIDLSPLMSLADTWTGSKMAPQYKAPESTPERVNQIMALQNALAKQKQGLSDSELSLLKNRIGGEESMTNTKNAFEMMKLKREELKGANADRATAKNDAADRDDKEKLLKSTTYKTMDDTVRGRGFLTKVQQIIADNGGVIPLYGPKRAKFQAAFKDMQMDAKELAKLGALSGPDMGLIEGSLGSDSVWKQAIDNVVGSEGGVQGFLSRLSVANEKMERLYGNARKDVGIAYKLPTSKELIAEKDKQFSSSGVPAAKTQAANTHSDADISAAKKWAQENPADPRSAKIMETVNSQGAR